MSKKITLEGLDHFKDNENAMIAGKPESTNTATVAHAVGEYFYWKGVLHIVTAAIAVGGTIQTNTNVKPAVLADDVSTLKESISDNESAFIDFASGIVPSLKKKNDFVANRRYLTSGFATVANYACSKNPYPAGNYTIEAIAPGWVAVGYISDTEGVTIVSNWTVSKTSFTAEIPFYITFNSVSSSEVLDHINADFVVKQILNDDGNTLTDRVDDLENDTISLSNDIEAFSEKVDSVISDYVSENLFNGKTIAEETIRQSDGAFISNSAYARSDYIPVKTGKVNIGVVLNNSTSIPQVVVHIAVYNSSKVMTNYYNGNSLNIMVATNMQYSQIDVQEDGYVAFDIYISNRNLSYLVSCGEAPTEYIYYYERETYLNPKLTVPVLKSMTYGVTPAQAKSDSLADGETIIVESNSILNNYEIAFYAKVTSFDTLYVGHGKSSYGYYIKIDNENITYCSNGVDGTSIPHNLTITSYINVIIKVNTIGTPTIIVNTFGGTKTDSHGTWTGRKDSVFAESAGSTLTGAVLTWNSDYYKKAIWAFGDSYFANQTSTRWPYYVIHPWGFDNVLLNAYPGENSASSYTDLLTAANHGTPKYLLWCVGLNDADTTSINANWLNIIKKVESFCERKNITLIMATIPEVTATGYSNAYKNNYVKESGYRYIDFAGAVDEVANWLSDDGVHPNADGAQLLASKAITDFPELLQKS